MKILLCNFWYGLDSDWKYLSYITHQIWKKKHERIALEKLRDLIIKEDPDIICICEITDGQLNSPIIQDLNYIFNASTKYSKDDKIGKYIFWHHRLNIILTKKEYTSQKIYLSHGTKKLIYKFQIEKDMFLYFGHFSLRRNIRKKQFLELWKIIDSSKKNIICGDFNIFWWTAELQELANIARLKIYSPWKTFPAHTPKYYFDMFLVSEDVWFDVEILPDILSDHLAINGKYIIS